MSQNTSNMFVKTIQFKNLKQLLLQENDKEHGVNPCIYWHIHSSIHEKEPKIRNFQTEAIIQMKSFQIRNQRGRSKNRNKILEKSQQFYPTKLFLNFQKDFFWYSTKIETPRASSESRSSKM